MPILRTSRQVSSALLLSALSLSSFASTGRGQVNVGKVPPTDVGRELGGDELHLDLSSGTAYVVT